MLLEQLSNRGRTVPVSTRRRMSRERTNVPWLPPPTPPEEQGESGWRSRLTGIAPQPENPGGAQPREERGRALLPSPCTRRSRRKSRHRPAAGRAGGGRPHFVAIAPLPGEPG